MQIIYLVFKSISNQINWVELRWVLLWWSPLIWSESVHMWAVLFLCKVMTDAEGTKTWWAAPATLGGECVIVSADKQANSTKDGVQVDATPLTDMTGEGSWLSTACFSPHLCSPSSLNVNSARAVLMLEILTCIVDCEGAILHWWTYSPWVEM